jgi:RNA polymerase sigma-70 factor (ECF subfamily)
VADHREFLREFLTVRDRIFAFLLSVIGNRQIAEDLFQDVSVLLWEKFDQYQPGTSFVAWARQIAFNLVRNERRRLARSRLIFSEAAMTAIENAFQELDDEAVEEEWLNRLDECVGELGPASQALLKLRYHKEQSLQAIADHLGRTMAGVNSSLVKIRKALETCLQRGETHA